MYAVVGCGECSALWIVEGRSETSQCPRCGTRRPRKKRKTFVETDDVDHAREVRASMLANRQDHGEAFAEIDSYADLESAVEDGVIDDEEYVDASGLDAAELSLAGERASRSPMRTGSRKGIVERALEELEEPTREEVIEYAVDRGVPEGYVERALEKLVRRGAVTENRGRYRLV